MELGRWLIHACTISIVLLLHINASLSLGHHHANVTARCLERERDALLAIKGDLVDEYNLLSSWGSEDCCGWERVHCDPHSGHVIQLHLGGVMEVSQRGLDQLEMYNPQLYFSDSFYQQGILKKFGGQVSPKIIELQYLEYLDLSLNSFNATQFPALICSLSNLRHLDLSDNHLNGSNIPELIGNLTNLRYLDLSWNFLGDETPVSYHQLGNLTHLQYLNLGFNYYTHMQVVENLNWLPHLSSLKYLYLSRTNLRKVSDWLETINKLPNLKNLTLYGCDLPPPILSTLSHINSSNSLVSVDLSDNVVTSSIFKWLCNYNTTLSFLDLRSTQLSGLIPDAFANMISLKTLYLSFNQLSGFNPHVFANMSSLAVLDLSFNQLTGSIPDVFTNMKSLAYLGLSSNQLSGLIPDVFANMSSLAYLNLSFNQLSGLIPDVFANMSSLAYLDLSFNQLSGLIPDVFANMKSLAYLDLSSNQLSGSIPDVFANMSSLKSLDLSFNQLSGLIPDVFANMSSLAHLGLSSNQLSGSIPDVFANMKSLKSLDLSFNQLSGSIPDVFANMSSLKSLDLSFNQLSGLIPDVFANMSSLAHLGLSSNQLSGLIPDVFANMKSLAYLGLSSNQLSGLIPDVFANMSSLKSLELSFNQLSGLIPDVFANMSSLAHLGLSFNQLSGLIPDVFANMKSLAYLGLSSNQLSGLIPDVFANMSSLAVLDLSSNQLSGLIPYVFANMSSLENLDLSHNPLKRGIPASISQLCSLRSVRISSCNLTDQLVFSELVQRWSTCPHILLNSLDLSDNNLAGSFPNLTNFSSLEVLQLSKNNFSGMVPDSIGQLSRLSELDLSGNQLSGRIPQSIGQLSSLSYMNLSVNHLVGEISEIHFSKLFNLRTLDLSGNSLLKFNVTSGWVPSFQLYFLSLKTCNVGPKFPKWLRTQKGLSSLDMSYGHIVDVFPSWLWTIFGYIATIDLSYNQLKGTIRSSEVVSLSGVEVRFSSNQLEGPIPSFLSNASYVDLSDNKLSDMSSLVCSSNFKISKFLDLSKNRISGEVPDCWRQWGYLELLDLSDNSFSGKIPPSIGYIHGIKTLKLRSNKLVGALPSSLKNCTSLNVIDLGNNQLSSSVPDWIGASLPDLVILMLQFNQLSGSLPSQLCHLPHLQILDVSVNEISGTIPKCLNNLTSLAQEGNSNLTIRHSFNISEAEPPMTSLYYDDDATFMWKGTLASYKNTLGLVKRIDLSSNRLTGEIPSEITYLVGLVSLNLSNNSLSGQIPLDIGKLKSLDSLDLSINKIGGGIPTSLAHIDRLGAMNLSYNNLSGEIPIGTQLQGFNASSYIGNPWLCGLPLHVCDPEGTGRPYVSSGEDDADELITQGFYISLGLGFAVGFWGICGSLIFKKSWRYAYYNFLNASNDWLYVKVVLIRRHLKDWLKRQQS